jgi:hypothetical protein
MAEFCKKCSSMVEMIVMKGSGFCSARCSEEYDDGATQQDRSADEARGVGGDQEHVL